LNKGIVDCQLPIADLGDLRHRGGREKLAIGNRKSAMGITR
jgi:hypothetical protein